MITTTILSFLPQIGFACTATAAAATCLVKIKRKTPISRKDADVLWKLHKQAAHCPGHRRQLQTGKHGEITGFECQCGYRYTQKRPLV